MALPKRICSWYSDLFGQTRRCSLLSVVAVGCQICIRREFRPVYGEAQADSRESRNRYKSGAAVCDTPLSADAPVLSLSNPTDAVSVLYINKLLSLLCLCTSCLTLLFVWLSFIEPDIHWSSSHLMTASRARVICLTLLPRATTPCWPSACCKTADSAVAHTELLGGCAG